MLILKNQIDKYYDIVKQVEQQFNIVFEHEFYKSIHYMSVNDYIAILPDNSTKEKGMFVTQPDFGDSVNFLVIPKALKAYFLNKVKPEEFIKNHINSSPEAIYDYCMSPKVDRSYTVIYLNQKQQRLNRIYPTKNLQAGYLYKCRDGSYYHMLKDSAVELFNNYKKGPYNINYNYFISKVNEIINYLEPKQLTLF